MIENTRDKSIIYFTRLHWIVFFWPVVFLGAAVAVSIYVTALQELGLAFMAFSLIWILMTWVTYYFSSVTIKKNQIILRTGIIVRQTIDIPLSKIEAIDIRQSIFGSMMRYGMLSITGTGGTRRLINYLNNPLTCRRYIEQLMNEPHSQTPN